jgi:hypothetical protein
MQIAIRFMVLFFMFSTNLWANNTSSPWYTQDVGKKTNINVELFLSSTCAHCQKADAFFREIEAQSPWLHVKRYMVNDSKEALIRFNQLLAEQQMSDFAVPSVYFCDSRWVGFATAETTGKNLVNAINYCKHQIEKKGALSPATVNTLRRWANANLFDSAMTEDPTVAKYITVIALMDAFNPCALFCLASLFALIFMQDTRKEQLISGLLFIVPVGIVHFFQQAYTSAFFEVLPWFRLPAFLVGVFALYLVAQSYKKKPTHNLFFLLALLLGFIIQTYQQTCLMNWSLIFEQWLYNQQVSNAKIGLYELAYQCMYLSPLLLILFLFVLLIQGNRLIKFKPKLNYIGLLYILVISLFLLLYPMALSKPVLSVIVVFGVYISGLILSKYNDSRNNFMNTNK